LGKHRPRRPKRPRITTNLTDSEIIYDRPGRALRDRRPQNTVNYNLLTTAIIEEDAQSDTGKGPDRPLSRNAARGAPYRSLFDIGGPFGGNIGGNRSLPFGPDAQTNAAVIGDDSSDDEGPARPTGGVPGVPPMTPQVPQTHNLETGGPMNLGRVSKKEMADVTPLGVSSEIGFDSVGGLDDHINKLKEMVLLPLLYPEVYSKWKIPPPRGVLFHGPPGTGKTLLARALASSVSTKDRKVTFYMRKGADVMSKWVGEAERQLRLLFEEAKKNQPAIIFFDEFDGKC
jgi:ATPase family AAA domain-containing protein 2